MPAYWIATLDVTDPEKYKGYVERAPAAIKKYGGRTLSLSGDALVLEGEPPRSRIALIEFDSVEQAKACYDSPEYQEAVSHRKDAAVAQFFVVDGL